MDQNDDLFIKRILMIGLIAVAALITLAVVDLETERECISNSLTVEIARECK